MPYRIRPLDLAIILLIALTGLLAYGGSLENDFVWDDEATVKNNPFVKDWKYLPSLLTEDVGAGVGVEYRYIRPLQMFLYLVGHSLWGLDVRGYHAMSLFFHCLTAAFLFLMLLVLFQDRILAVSASLLFVVHPVQTVAVAYISSFADPLAASFILLALFLYIKRTEGTYSGFGSGLLILGFYLLAVFSKEVGALLPALVLIYHATSRRRIDRIIFIPMLAFGFIYVAWRLWLLGFADTGFHLRDRAALFFASIANYSKIAIFPVGLRMDYGFPTVSYSDPKVIAGAVILAAAVIGSICLRKKKTVLFSLGWFFITLYPSTTLSPAKLHSYMAENWLYIPSMGYFIILGSLFSYLWRGQKTRKISVILALSLILSYLGLTIKQNTYWKNNESINQYFLKCDPNSWKAHFNIGVLRKKEGKITEAISEFRRSLKFNPGNAVAYYNLGSIYVDSGDFWKAMECFENAVKIKPKYTMAYNNLANVYYAVGRTRDAIDTYKKALSLQPHEDIYFNLGNKYLLMKEYDEAISSYQKALALNPDDKEARLRIEEATRLREEASSPSGAGQSL